MIFRRVSDWPSLRVHPIEELERMRSQIERIFTDLSQRTFGESTAGVFPLVNLTENTDNYYIRAELPGIKSEDLDMSITGDTFSITGERKIPEEGSDAKYHRREREAGKFSRIIKMPSLVQADKVEAETRDGVLTVILPKAEEAKPKQITIKVK
jgi:HSP20 family protein